MYQKKEKQTHSEHFGGLKRVRQESSAHEGDSGTCPRYAQSSSRKYHRTQGRGGAGGHKDTGVGKMDNVTSVKTKKIEKKKGNDVKK